MTAEEYLGKWVSICDVEEANRLIKSLSEYKHLLCPRLKYVFKALHLCQPQDVRILVLGQDPYPNDKATGIAFANAEDTAETDYSPSLDILKESVINFSVPQGHITFDPTLETWERQGVLLLNAALTCLKGRPGSHSLLWRPFMAKLLKNLSAATTGIVFILLGNEAQAFSKFIDNRFHHVLTEKHPAWYAKQKIPMPPTIWNKANEILIGQNGYGVKWYNNL